MYKMELEKFFSHTQYALPVGGVLILAILVFIFGFKSVAEPSFEKAPVEGKKKKPAKQKQAKKVVSNGSAIPATVETKKGTTTPTPPKPSPAKTATKKADSPKKSVPSKALEQPVVPKAEKKAQKQPQLKEPKPADFDEGDWQAVNKKEKKKRPDGGASASASPAASPTHQPKAKKSDKKKNSKEEVKETEPIKPVAEPIKPAAELETRTKDPLPVEKVIEATPTEVKKAEPIEAAPKKEKNNNKPKPDPVVVEPTVVVDESAEDPWQENKAAKKKKKARRD